MEVSLKDESKLLIRHSAIYGVGNLLNIGAAFILLPIYTQALTKNDYGIKELVGLTTDIALSLLSTTIASALMRFYFEYEDERNRNEVISTASFALGVIGAAGAAILSLFSGVMARYILNTSSLYYFFVLSFSSMWFQCMLHVGENILRARQKSVLFITQSMGRLLLAVALNIYFVVMLRKGVYGILLSTLITSIVSAVAVTGPIWATAGFRVSWTKLKDMVKFGLPMIPSQMGAFVVHISDRFFLKAYTSVGDVGIYSLGYRFGTVPNNFVSSPFNLTWLPRRFELYKQPDSERVFGRIFTYFLVVMLYGSLGVSVLTRDILRIIARPEYWSAHTITPIIALGMTIFCCHYHFNMGIMIHKQTKYLAYINFSNGVLVLLANFVFIKRYTLYGAAWVTVAGFIYKVALTYYFSSKYYRIYFETARILKVTAVSVLLYGTSLFIHSPSLIADVAARAGLLAMFPVLLLALKFFTRDELEVAKRFVVRGRELLPGGRV